MRSSLLQRLGNVYSRSLSAFPGCASAGASTELLATRLTTLTRGFHTGCVREAWPLDDSCRSRDGQWHGRASFLLESAQLLSLKVSSVLYCSSLSCMELRSLVLHFYLTACHSDMCSHLMLMCRATLPAQLCGRVQIRQLLGSTPSCKPLLQSCLSLHPLQRALQCNLPEQHKPCCGKPRSAPKS